MLKSLAALSVWLLIASTNLSLAAANNSKDFGLGIILGEPTGFTAKYFVTQQHALDLGLAYSFAESFHVYGDWLFHWPEVFASKVPELTHITPYAGLGGGVRIIGKSEPKDGDARGNLFLKIPLGLEWTPNNGPLGIFAEIAPGVGIIPKTFLLIHGGAGVRFYF